MATPFPTHSTQPPRELFRGRPAHASQAGSYATAVLFVIGAIVSLFLVPPPISFAVSIALAVVGITTALRAWLRILSTAYRLNTQRLEVERGIVSKRIDNLELWRV